MNIPKSNACRSFTHALTCLGILSAGFAAVSSSAHAQLNNLANGPAASASSAGSPTASPSPTGTPVPTVERPALPAGLSQDCINYIHTMPAELEYDFIEVPEDYDHPDTSPKLNIFYYMPKLHSQAQAAKKPIAYYNGGPGYPSHNIYEYFKALPAANGVPFLYIDQRGTGCSGSLPTVPVTLEGSKRIALYGSRNIVLDSEMIRKHLFPDGRQWRAFGQSFGGYVVQRYVQIAPEALEKAYAHGASLMTDGTAWGADRLLGQKRAGILYNQQYPGDQDILTRAKSLMPADYCTGNATAVTCGAGLLDEFGWESLGFTSGWAGLHKSITSLLDPAGNLNLVFLNAQIPPKVSTKDSMSDFMVAVVPGREMPAGALNTWSCEDAIARLISQNETPLQWEFNECRLDMATKAKYDSFIRKIVQQDYISIPGVQKSLESFPALDFFLYSGERDAIVPRESFAEEVSTLGSRIHYVNFPNTGHNWMGEAQIWKDLNL